MNRYERAATLLREHYPDAVGIFTNPDFVEAHPDPVERERALVQFLQQKSHMDLEPPQEGERPSVRAMRKPERGHAVQAALARLDEPDAPEAPTVADVPTVPAVADTEAVPDASTVSVVAVDPTTVRRTKTPEEQEQGLAQWLFRILDEIGPTLPPMVFLGYLHCWRLADWQSGEFYISHERMAERLGSADRSTGKRVMRTLVAAGVVTITIKGNKHKATTYRLAPRSAFKRHRVIAAVVSTWMKLNPKMLVQETGSIETQ